MSRWYLRAAALAVLAVGLDSPVAQAQFSAPHEITSPDANPLLPPSAVSGQLPPSAAMPQLAARQIPAAQASVAAGSVVMPQQAGYVNLNAPMYPSPRPNIPIWTGSTMITNQAFAPHEFLYPHTYRAMYPPFYHRVHGKFMWTPFGMRTHEHWQLQGTMVEVKYRSSWPKWSGPHKPVISKWGGPWK